MTVAIRTAYTLHVLRATEHGYEPMSLRDFVATLAYIRASA